MSADLSKAYELLGVKPGVSNRELKAAHRDLAKVWHPDRFLHDPRLQEKAQEKLKEINEAYDLLISGKIPRPTPTPPPRSQQAYSPEKPTTSRQGISWQWAAVPLLIFAAVFAITTRALLKQRSEPVLEQSAQAEEAVNVDQDRSTRPDSNTRAEVREGAQKDSTTESAAPVSVTTEPTPALPTVTVTIDPESGLLAKADCPLRSRMTYPSGSAPSGTCNLNHTPPPKESRIKSLATRVFPQKRKDAKKIEEVQ